MVLLRAGHAGNVALAAGREIMGWEGRWVKDGQTLSPKEALCFNRVCGFVGEQRTAGAMTNLQQVCL